MERPRGFFTKRSEHYNNIQKEENNKKKAIEESLSIKEPGKVKQEQSPSPKVENLDPNKAPQPKTPSKSESSLKRLETLAQKAGITFDEKYEMEKSQSPAQQQVQQQQQQQQAQAQMSITSEQLQQLQQQCMLQQYVQPGTIHVKQEYATQQQQQQIGEQLKNLQDHQMQQMQFVQEAPQSPHQNSQNALQQAVTAEWQHGRVLLQQPMQNQYMQYSPQLVMSGNLLHSGMGQQQQIQLIAAGKPFQNQLTPQMLTTGGKPVLTSGGQASFGGYTIPTIPSSQSQTVLFSPVTLQTQQSNQQNILPTMQSQSTPTKSDGQKQMGGQKILQKVSQGGSGQQQQTVTQAVANQQANQQCVQVSNTMPTTQLLSGQTMQFASPWQQMGFWSNGAIQPQTLLTTNPIFYRGTNPDGTPGVFLQQAPTAQATQQTVQSPHNQISIVGNIAQATAQKVRPAGDNLAPKTQQIQQRAPMILPQGAQIRPASSVSTQTAMNQNANLLAKAPKVRTKQTPVRPAAPNNIKVSLNQQTGQQTMMQQVVTPGGVNKMIVMNTINGQLTPVMHQNNTQQMTNDKLKSQQQQVILQQAMANMQQNAVQQQQQQQQQQHQQLQQHLVQMQLQQQFINQQNQNTQLMTQSGNLQQLVLQQAQQLPTVTVNPGVSLQQSMTTHMPAQSIMAKAGQILQMQPVSSQAASVPTSMSNVQMVTSVANSMANDPSNSILGPLSSPQTTLQPPQNPLIAMTTLSASPMSGGMQKDKVDASTEDSQKSNQGISVTLSPMKRPNEDSKQNEAKKVEDSKKTEDSSIATTNMSSPSTNKNSSAPTTPNSATKTTTNSPLAAQNGESDSKKSFSNACSSPMLKNELPKALVKPNVSNSLLTHVIEGYVIQESNEPFPVTRQRYSEKENDEPPKKKQALEDTKTGDAVKVNGDSGTSSGVTSSTAPQLPTDMVACDHCEKQEIRSKLKRKRFCSTICARASKSVSTDSPNVSLSNGDDKNQVAQSLSQNDKSKSDGENGDASYIEEHVMLKWNVAQVCEFIKNLPGCTDYAEDFKLQEIDGQALLLLKENHLVSAMGMKLGPALKIVNKIESMRVSKEGEATETPPEQQ